MAFELTVPHKLSRTTSRVIIMGIAIPVWWLGFFYAGLTFSASYIEELCPWQDVKLLIDIRFTNWSMVAWRCMLIQVNNNGCHSSWRLHIRTEKFPSGMRSALLCPFLDSKSYVHKKTEEFLCFEKAIVHRNGEITFVFYNGTEMSIGA